MASSLVWSRRALVVMAVAAMVLAAQSSEAAARSGGADEDELRFPGFPGGRQRNPGFPGVPGGRVASPPASRFKPSSPPPSPPPPLQSSPAISPPCVSSGAPSQPALQPLPGFPGLQQPGNGGGSASSPADCVTPLAGLMTCASFLTGSEPDTPTPQSECCSGLGMFLNSTAAVDDRSLRCLCPVILGDVNRMLPKPIDPVRMMYLPISCGVVLPPQVLFICFTGQPTPPVVSRIPDSWMTPASSALTP
ncbi:hypothetical protein CFC21_065249 [Triticum aestivum]|uniref:Bifunctional inhibitor/plant lipid transfer protein/seed storage helical domain-containing protein n=3 Tax=Triticum TaxID=4564 RepID=A0A9R0TRJ1_TRITD|nr:leucine-rich repeat extensin-like protein 5 [Triticum dicoccoides]XP_044380606.1 leucine-rich repeat extensin-like protein 5 [Triticum aestivum]KAF7058123.1 hypothetical protein CFC21_065249 [Triticum aestivum]VAI16035.1 unnamed protein product [Triticum turgidum subsp. durum]